MDKLIEKWIDIKGYEGYYQISNFGNVKSLERYVNAGKGLRISKERILKHGLMTSGYPQVGLSINGKSKYKSIHSLLANAFIPNPENRTEINHINGIKTDNRVDNLEWCTRSQNCKHAYDKGLNGCSDKKRKALSRKVIDTSTDIVYDSIKEAAAGTGIVKSYLYAMLCGTSYNCSDLMYYSDYTKQTSKK